jgi:membrane protease YdiL (CAAX protease family)
VGQAHALVNLFILLALPIGALVLAFAVGTAMVNPSGSAKLALAFYLFGLILFLIAKIPAFRSGRLITFGSKSMRPGYRIVYRAGYVLMVAGALFAAGLLATGKSGSLPKPGGRSESVGQAPLNRR